jgi:hypothetical protein
MYQGYVEAVLSRAALRGQSLDFALSNDHNQWYGTGKNRYQGYYDHRTIVKLGRQFSQDQLARASPKRVTGFQLCSDE